MTSDMWEVLLGAPTFSLQAAFLKGLEAWVGEKYRGSVGCMLTLSANAIRM